MAIKEESSGASPPSTDLVGPLNQDAAPDSASRQMAQLFKGMEKETVAQERKDAELPEAA